MEPLLAAVLLLLPLLLLPYYIFHLSRSARLVSSLPGPKPLPIIGNTLEFGTGTVDFMTNLIRLWSEYGNLYRVWMGNTLFIMMADVKYVEQLLTSNVHITKNISYKFLEPWLGTGLLTSTGNKWRHHRKIITPTFHFKILEEFVDVFNKNCSIMINKLKKEVNGPEFDIYSHVTLCALDIICESAMGIEMNCQDSEESEYVNALKEVADVVMKRTFRPWLYPTFLFNMSDLKTQQEKALKVLHDTTRKVIFTRKMELLKEVAENKSETSSQLDNDNFGQKKRLAFLDLLLKYSKDGGNLTDEDIREEVDTFMFEGHDTTASGISFCLFLLSRHSEVQDKVYKEMKELFGDSDREATFRDLQEMKYLECVIKESRRIYPSVVFFARELEEEAKLDGLHLPKGANILFTTYMMNRNPDYFPDPEKFDPERFQPDNAQGRNPYSYVPFSAGPRNCIGQRFAMMEMKAAVSKMIRNFKLLPGTKEPVLSIELVLRSWGGIFLKLENRVA